MSGVTHDMLIGHHHSVAERVARTVALWRGRIRERRAFHSLGHRELRDLGVSQWELERELAKPFWRD